jgi:diadenosine tetraphosphate (Ap4A) HIT family hydrolase
MISGFWRAVTRVAEQLGVSGGYRIGSNVGPGGGQVVFHFHVHILSGPRQ